MISHEYKCIFIHIPKTAGTSIEFKLGHFDEFERGVQDHRSIREIEPLQWRRLAQLILTGSGKALMRYLRAVARGERFGTRRRYNQYFKFAFVRNPWARVVSWYKNVMRDDIHRHELDVQPDCTFEDFVRRHLNQWALRPQLYWITDTRGRMAMDFVGRFESLDEHFAEVCTILGIADPTLTQMVRSDGRSYISFYDRQTRDIVAAKYAEEIEVFHFGFGD